ncbi:phasin family protein [Caenimonas terrae]|uniref:Phasin family protein n=1 Tax=Caenimonas terrae TaxID=696074 RepID=A0ABW0NL41_9BURK
MTARKPRRAPVPAEPDPIEAVHLQEAVASESAEAMRRGLENMRRINDRAVQAALQRFTKAAEGYKAPRAPLDLLTIPTELLRSQMEATANYWQELSGAALEMQAEVLGCSSHLVNSDAVLQAASAMDALPAFGLYGMDRLLGPRKAAPGQA